MNFTEEMINEDEKRWHARNVVKELGYCGNYMRDRKNMTNLNIRFYAYIMRKAAYMLKEQEPVKAVADGEDSYMCNNCGTVIGWAELAPGGIEEVKYKFCPECGRPVKWE